MKTVEKIIDLIKSDKEIAENLFLFSEFPEDVKLWTGEDEDHFDYSNIKWLFSTYQENLSLIGINTIDESIWCIDNEGFFNQYCDALQNLPYEILRIESFYTKNETVEDYYKKVKDYKETLKKYELWSKNNGIVLDIKKVYHDESGNLFTQYFDK